MPLPPILKKWIRQWLETEGAKNKAYDSNVDGVFDAGTIPDLDASKITSGVFDLARIPTITRDKLEYPTEDVNLVYLLAINKANTRDWNSYSAGACLETADSFADKAVEAFIIVRDHSLIYARRTNGDVYLAKTDTTNSSREFLVVKNVGGTSTKLGEESVELTLNNGELIKLSCNGSSIKAFRRDMTTAKISATDSDLTSGTFGQRMFEVGDSHLQLPAWLRAPSTPLPQAKCILEAEVVGSGTEEDPLQPDLKREITKHEKFGEIDLASVTWNAFEPKEGHNTMLITITEGNSFVGYKAINQQIAYAKSKNLKVFKPPADYNEACKIYEELKKEFPEWLVGKNSFAYQTLGHEDFDAMQVADTYYSNIVDGIKSDAYKNVPDWEMRKTLHMWKERLKKAKVMKSEAEKCLKKLEEVEKVGW